jgi:DNA-binding NarL/FixJ family response regulator
MTAQRHTALMKMPDRLLAVHLLMQDGYSTFQIAGQLGIAFSSAKSYRRKVNRRLAGT